MSRCAPSAQRIADALFTPAQRLVDEVNQPRVAMEVAAGRALSCFYGGRVREVRELVRRVRATLVRRPASNAEANSMGRET